jgi:hypothetical protein
MTSGLRRPELICVPWERGAGEGIRCRESWGIFPLGGDDKAHTYMYQPSLDDSVNNALFTVAKKALFSKKKKKKTLANENQSRTNWKYLQRRRAESPFLRSKISLFIRSTPTHTVAAGATPLCPVSHLSGVVHQGSRRCCVAAARVHHRCRKKATSYIPRKCHASDPARPPGPSSRAHSSRWTNSRIIWALGLSGRSSRTNCTTKCWWGLIQLHLLKWLADITLVTKMEEAFRVFDHMVSVSMKHSVITSAC